MARVGVVTVTYRGGDTTLAWARALQRAWEPVANKAALVAIAVDNASGDGTPERLRAEVDWVSVVQLDRNRGFAHGCNRGISEARAAGADLVVIVNPDIEFAADFFERLVELHWPPSLAARGPQIVGPGGGVEQSARGFPRASTGLFGRTSLLARVFPESRAARRELRSQPEAGTAEVDWVSGACMIVPLARFDQVGGFDDGYFMYWEDADWCRRAWDRELRVEYEPALVVHHRQGSSSKSRPFATTVSFHRSAFRYYRMHAATNSVQIVAAGTALAGRCLLKLGANGARRALGFGRGAGISTSRGTRSRRK